MLNQREATESEIAGAVARLAILSGLCVWVFWPEAVDITSRAPKYSETAHALVTPLAVLLLVYCRRTALAKNLTKGSVWGIVLLVVGLFLYAGTTWPFRYGYARNMATVPILAGAVLAACGWRTLKLSLPMLLLVLLSIPIGTRLYATLIIRPETYTTAATTTALDQLPGIDTWVEGTDLFFSSKQSSGVIGLGEFNRGARLLLAFATVGVFVTFSRIRPLWRVAASGVAAAPIVLFCNFFRLLCWGLVVIYTGVGAASALPRNVSTVCSLLLSYGLFAFVCAFRLNLFIEDGEKDKDANTGEVIHAQS